MHYLAGARMIKRDLAIHGPLASHTLDRRREPRFPSHEVPWISLVSFAGAQATLLDVSARGVLLRMSSRPEHDVFKRKDPNARQRPRLVLKLESHSEVQASGQVIRCAPVRTSTLPEYEVAFSFDEQVGLHLPWSGALVPTLSAPRALPKQLLAEAQIEQPEVPSPAGFASGRTRAYHPEDAQGLHEKTGPRTRDVRKVKNYITPSGLQRLVDERRFLLTRERPAVTQVVAWAASNGDRSENADYQYGKRRLREIDRRIRFLTKRIDAAKWWTRTLPKRAGGDAGLLRRDRALRQRGGSGAGSQDCRRGRGRPGTPLHQLGIAAGESVDEVGIRRSRGPAGARRYGTAAHTRRAV